MSEPVSTQSPTQETPTPRGRSLIDRMRDRLRGFALRDRQGVLVGEVQDLIPDADNPQKHFNLVILQPDTHQGSRLFLLRNRQLERIDIPARSLFTKLSGAEIRRLADYTPNPSLGRSDREIRASLSAPDATLPTATLPTLNSVDRPAPSVSLPDIAEQSTEQVPALPSNGHHAQVPNAQTPEAQVPSIVDPANEQIIQLLEERLLIERSKRKAGEIVVRKVVETRMVQVPVRREKLIVEQVGSSYRQLAEIDISSGKVTGVDLAGDMINAAGDPTVYGEFSPQIVLQLLDTIARTIRHRCKQINLEILLSDRGSKTYHQFPSPQLASQILTAIVPTLAHRCPQVQLELILEDADIQKTYQKWFDHYRNQ